MDLHITFRGLCLFVPSNDRKHLHVLFPETSHHSGPHVHHPEVRYNAFSRKLLKSVFHFGGLRPSSNTLPSPLPNILPVGRIANKPVLAVLLTDNPGPTVATRISLPAPAKVEPAEKAWFTRTENGQLECLELTHQVTLVYQDVDTGKLKPKTKQLGGSGTIVDLQEPNSTSGNVIDVLVTHLPDHDVDICPGQAVEHAPMYYAFLGAANDPLILDEDPGLSTCGPWQPRCGSHEFSEEFRNKFTGTAFNCMLAQADPE